VVLLSVLVHGTGIAIFLRRSEAGAPDSPEVTRAPTARPAAVDAPVPEKITFDELDALRKSGAPIILADVRTERSYAADNLKAEGAIRLPPDDAVRRARELGLDHHATVVLYCA
jgi:hypothetical protein